MSTYHQLPQGKQTRSQCTSPDPLPTTGTHDDRTTLIPDAALPEQFFDPPRRTIRTSGQAALMQAVLTEAMECYQKQFVATDIMNHKHEHVDAIAIWGSHDLHSDRYGAAEASP